MTATRERTAADHEASIGERVDERPEVHPSKVREVRLRHLGVRFAAGAATSIAAGVLTLACGARVGGIMLAFPAILAASLTLIEKQDDSAEAREDARGATVGALALAAFAAVAAIALGHVSGAVALLLASVVWCVVAVLGYLIAWFR